MAIFEKTGFVVLPFRRVNSKNGCIRYDFIINKAGYFF